MSMKEYSIDGKTYDLTKVAEYVGTNKEAEALLTLQLLTGKDEDSCRQIIEEIKPQALTEISDFKNYPIDGKTYNIEKAMDALCSGDMIAAFSELKSMGINEDAAKKVIPVLMNNLNAYKMECVANQSSEEQEIARKRALDPDWFAPAKCPNCGAVIEWGPQGQTRGGFSGGKAIAGAVLLGPIGIAAGALGKKQIMYQCTRCGYTERYSKNSKSNSAIGDKLDW